MSNRDKYRRAWLNAHKKYERRAAKQLQKYFRSQALSVPYKSLDVDNYQATIDNNIKLGDLYNTFFDIYLMIGMVHGERIGKQINRDIKEFKSDFFQSALQKDLYNWVMENVGHRIVSVREGYKKYITKLVGESFRQGMTPDELSRAIHRLINRRDFYRWQSLRIARTEASLAANRSAVIAGNSSGVVWDKEWISIPDNRVRTLEDGMFDHRAMDGVRVPKEGFFNINGEELEYPAAAVTKTGAKSSAGNVINCRCTVAVIARRDAQGRIIRDARGTQPIPRPRIPIVNRPIAVEAPSIPRRRPRVSRTVPKQFVAAKTRAEAQRRIVSLGVEKVNLRGTTKDEWNMILRTMEEEARFGGMTLKELSTFKSSRSNSYGLYYPAHQRIRLNLHGIDSHKKATVTPYPEQLKKWEMQLQRMKDEFLDNPDFSQSLTRARMRQYTREINKLKAKIDAGESARFWGVSSFQKDGLNRMRATLIHEMGHHRHYRQIGIRTPYNFDKRLSVSEYGRTDREEYLVEWYAHWRMYGNAGVPKDLLELFKALAL